MNFLTTIIMIGWIPVVLLIFKQFPAQRAIVISFLVAWMFLPEASYILPGIPDYTKMSATCYGILLATFIFDVGRFSSFRFSWLDLPWLLFCWSPIASSLTNGLGLYDGISAAVEQSMAWGGPYFLGRIYLNNLAGLRQLAIGIFIGGLIYVPFCLLELRIGPQLHQLLYGFTQTANWEQVIRYGGFRPMVFMQHGLMVGVWMMSATLIGIWFWKTGVIEEVWGIPIKWLVLALFITFILCKSTGAYVLLAIGVILLFTAKWLRTSFPVLLLTVVMCFYLYIAASGNFSGESVVDFVAQVINEDRAGSLDFRFQNEVLLSEKARQRVLFGWGGWGRARVYDEWGEDLTITDSLWIIVFGNNGLLGLVSLTASLLLPVIGFCLTYHAGSWSHRKIAPAATLTVLLTLYMLDSIVNAMVNPIFTLACGGISGLVLNALEARTTTNQQVA